MDFIQRRTGLLNEQGKDRYAFVHKTFQEYLTAEEIYDRFKEGEDEAIVEHIQAHLHDPHWREVLLLLVSKLKKKRAARAIEVILNARSEYKKWLKRDLLFAGWCLTEDPEGLKTVAEGLVGEILDGLIAIEISDTERNGNKAREESTEIIKRLGETAVEGDVWARLKAWALTSDRFRSLIDRFRFLINRFRLLEFQASLGQEGEAIETLLKRLKNDDSYTRCHAAVMLVQLGNASPEIVSGLLNLLKDDDSCIRESAACALGQLGNASPEVVSGLLNLLKDDDSSSRESAACALGQLGNVSPEVVSGLLNLLKDDDSFVYAVAACALVQLRNASPEIVSGLLNLLKDDDYFVRGRAAFALGQLGNASPEIVSGLLNLLKDDNSVVRNIAAESLTQLGKKSIEVLPALVQWIDRQPDDDAIGGSAKGVLRFPFREALPTILE